MTHTTSLPIELDITCIGNANRVMGALMQAMEWFPQEAGNKPGSKLQQEAIRKISLAFEKVRDVIHIIHMFADADGEIFCCIEAANETTSNFPSVTSIHLLEVSSRIDKAQRIPIEWLQDKIQAEKRFEKGLL